VYFWISVAPTASVTFTVKVASPPAVGVPLIVTVPAAEARHLVIEVPRPDSDWIMAEPEAKSAVLAAGATRVCVVSAILNAPDVAQACAEFRRRLTIAASSS